MKFYCEEQLAGIKTIDFYLLEETKAWPVHLTDRSAAQIIFDAEEHNIEATVEDKSFKNQTKNKSGKGGNLWEVDLSFNFVTRSEALEQLLEQYCNRPGVAVVCFYNGFKKLFGTNVEPLMMTYNVDDGTTPESKASTNISITGLQRNRPVYITF